MIIKRISRSGGSLVLALPKNFLSSLHLHQGSYVTVEISQSGYLVVKPLESTLKKSKKGGLA